MVKPDSNFSDNKVRTGSIQDTRSRAIQRSNLKSRNDDGGTTGAPQAKNGKAEDYNSANVSPSFRQHDDSIMQTFADENINETTRGGMTPKITINHTNNQ